MKKRGALSLCKCGECPLFELGRTKVWDRGPEQTGLVFVSEAPGYQEDAKGFPFAGRSGDLLNATLEEIGLERDRCWITNTVLCRPQEMPGKKDTPPPVTAIEACNERLRAEVKSRKPKVIVTLGAPASRTILRTSDPITSLAGNITWVKEFNAWVIPTFHPASVLHGAFGNFDRIYDAINRAKRLLFKEIPFPKKRYLFRQDKEWFYFDQVQWILSTIRQLVSSTVRHIAIDLETDGFNVVDDAVLEIGVSDGKTAWVFDATTLLGSKKCVAAMNYLLSEPDITWIAHNKKFDQQFMAREGLVIPEKFEDTMVWAMGMNERAGYLGLDNLSQVLLNEPGWKDETKPYLKGGKKFSNVPLELRAIRNARDTLATWKLYPVLKNLVGEEGKTAYVVKTLLTPAQGAFAHAETHGVLIDVDYVEEIRPKVIKGLDAARLDLQAFAKEAGFNSYDVVKSPKFTDGSLDPRSPIQLRHCAYETMGIRPIVKQKSSKKPTTDVTFLEKHAGNPFVDRLQFFRDWDHALSVYVDGVMDDVCSDGRIHPDILIYGAETGRLSIKNPPLQTIPKDEVVEEKGFPNLKRMFIPSPGMVWVHADFKQLEVRIAWHYSGDKNLGHDCMTQDLHATMASRVTGKKLANIGVMDRFDQKFITFGMMYNRKAFSISKALGWSIKKARAYIDEFWAKYPDYHSWWLEQQKHALEHGWLETTIGRRRRWNLIMPEFVPEIRNQAVNFPPQSLASDYNTYKFIELDRELRKRGWGFPLFPVHDSIEFELWEKNLDEAVDLIVRTMTTPPFETCATFEVDVEVGPSWGEVKKYAA